MRGAIDTETGALILTVDAPELERLVEQLRNGPPTVISLSPSPRRAKAEPISSLSLATADSEAVAIETAGDSATITGSPSGFAALARGVSEFAEYNDITEPGMHTHFDPRADKTGKSVLTPDSAPLVLTGPVPDEPHSE
ncbi:MAG TPA: hypothetical protein VGG40_01535 [Solirubrobacterales bacterium]|jgi:hypothetical protein